MGYQIYPVLVNIYQSKVFRATSRMTGSRHILKTQFNKYAAFSEKDSRLTVIIYFCKNAPS